MLLSGESSAGKTVLSHDIAFDLAEGRRWAGFQPPRPMRVLYVDLETPEFVFQEHVRIIGPSQNLSFIRDTRYFQFAI